MQSEMTPTNLGEAQNFIAERTNLPKQGKASLVSNVNRFADVVGMRPEHIPADVPSIRRLMDKADPGAIGLQAGNWTSITSGVWRALDLCGIHVVRANGFDPTPDVVLLVQGLPHTLQLQLTPMLKFFSATQTSPWAFLQTSVCVFRDWLEGHYSKTNWQRAFKRSIHGWNTARIAYPGRWPQVELSVDFGHVKWAKGWVRLSKLKADLDLHLRDLRRGRSRRRAGKSKIFEESTIEAREGYVMRAAWAAALELDIEPETIESLDFLTQPYVVEAIADYMVRLGGTEKSGNASQMLRHLNSIAKYWVKRSLAELEELKNIRKSVTLPPGPSDKNRCLLEKFRDEALRLRFTEKPEIILRKLVRKSELTTADIKQGMLAFLALLLTKFPMRISEIVALKYGATFFDTGDGRSRLVTVDLPPVFVKNNIARLGKFGPKLVELLDLYMKFIRPRLAPLSNPYLFPTEIDGARSSDHLSRCLADFTSRELGIRMTAHQWRCVVGYIFLVENPGCYETVRHFLGHKSITTTITYYAFMLTDDANAALDETIDDLASRSVPKPKGRGWKNSRKPRRH